MIVQRRWAEAIVWALLVAAMIAVGISAVFVVAPLFGSGTNEEFILFRYYGMRRGMLFRLFAGSGLACVGMAVVLSTIAPASGATTAAISSRYRAVVAVLSAGSDWLRSRSWVYWLIIATAVAYVNAVILLEVPWLPCLNPDSGGYFSFGLRRTIGYTSIVMNSIRFFETVTLLIPLQLNLLLFSFVSLAHSAARLFDSRMFGLAIVALLVPNGSILLLHDMILTEPIFVVLISLHLAAVLSLLHRFSRPMALAAGLTLGLAILVRPVGYSFLACVPALVWLARENWKSCALFAGGSIASLLLAASMFNYVNFGVFMTQAFGGMSLVGHVAHLIRSDMRTTESELAARIDNRTTEVREGLRDLTLLHDHWVRTMNVYNLLLWQHVFPEIVHEVDRRMPAASPAEKQVEINRISTELAYSTIRHDPGGYTRQVLAHYYGLWILSFIPYGTLGSHAHECFVGTREILEGNPGVFDRGVSKAPFLSPENLAKAEAGREVVRPLDAYWLFVTGAFQVPVIIFGFICSLVCIVLLPFRDRVSRTTQGIGYAALAMQAYFALVVGVQVAIPRYALVTEPYLVFIVTGGLMIFSQRGLRALPRPVALRADDGRKPI